MVANILPVILSGGSGSRLWPLSGEKCPKQFLNLTGEESLFQKTIQRTARFQNPLIVGNEEHRFIMAEQLRQIEMGAAGIILEPTPKDTAPAMVLACLEAISTGHKNDVLLILPSDQIIDDERAFIESVESGFSLVNGGQMVMFGSTPTAAKSGYGYIEMGSDIDGYGHEINSFCEKPDLQRAEEFFAAGNYLWSTSIYMFTPKQYLEVLEEVNPEMVRRCRMAHVERRVDEDFVRPGREAFESVAESSMTYTLMDFMKDMAVVPLMTAWNDVGGWGDLWQVLSKDEDGNHIQGNVMTEGTRDSMIHSESGMLAVMGLEDIVVVQTEGGTLVADKKKANLARKVFNKLKEEGKGSSAKEYTSWGYMKRVEESENNLAQLLHIHAGGCIDVQQYQKRITHWVITKGSALLSVDGKPRALKAGEIITFASGTVYGVKNNTNDSLEIMEITLGDMSEQPIKEATAETIEDMLRAPSKSMESSITI